jgi:hypothetical protein
MNKRIEATDRHVITSQGRRSPRLYGLVREFLAADGGLIHQAAFGDREYRHSVRIAPPHGFRIFAAGARACRSAGGARSSRCPCRNRNGRRLYAEFEFTGCELVERTLVFEEDDLAVGLTTQLSPNRELGHRGIADMSTTDVDPAMAVGAADDVAAFPNRWKHGVTVGFLEERAALTGIFENFDRVVVVVGPGQRCRQQRKYQQSSDDVSHTFLLK